MRYCLYWSIFYCHLSLYICFVATVEQSVGISIRETCLTNDENVPIAGHTDQSAMLRRISSKASISHLQSPWQPVKAPPREGDSELHSVFHKIRPIPKFLITRYLINPGCYAVAPVNICTFLEACRQHNDVVCFRAIFRYISYFNLTESWGLPEKRPEKNGSQT